MSAYIRYRHDRSSPVGSGVLAVAPPSSRLPPSRGAADFAERLRLAASACTVGVRTLSGMSAKSMALDRAARALGALPMPAEQDAALAAILAEAATLWPDQAAWLLSGLIDALLRRGLQMQEGARLAAGPRLLGAALALAPSLASVDFVADAPTTDQLNRALLQLAQRKEFRFDADVFDQLEAAGLCGAVPAPALGGANAEAEARALRRALLADDPAGQGLAWFAGRAASLPSHLRGRMLALLVNRLCDPIWMRAGFEMIGAVGGMIHDLPPTCRITALEAFHNRIASLPGESARFCHALVGEAVHALPERDGLFGRTRRDLVASLRRQGERLDGQATTATEPALLAEAS